RSRRLFWSVSTGESVKRKFFIHVAGLIFTMLMTACATPPAQVSTVSARHLQQDRAVKRIVVVVGHLAVLTTRLVPPPLLEQLKSNEVRALVLEHNPALLPQDPIRANQDAVRALRPNA